MAKGHNRRPLANRRSSARSGVAGLAMAGALGLFSPVLLAQTEPQTNTPPIGRPVAAPPQPAAAPPVSPAPARTDGSAVPLRAGEHPTYTRLVFDWPQRVEFDVTTEGEQATIRFASRQPIDLGRLPQFPPRSVRNLAWRAQGDGSVVSFAIPEGASIKSWRNGTKVVIDITPSAEPKSASAEAAPAPKPMETKATETKPAETKPAAGKTEPKAAEAKPAQAAPAPAAGAGAPVAPKAPATPAAPPPPAAQAPTSTQTPAGASAAGVPAAAPVAAFPYL